MLPNEKTKKLTHRFFSERCMTKNKKAFKETKQYGVKK